MLGDVNAKLDHAAFLRRFKVRETPPPLPSYVTYEGHPLAHQPLSPVAPALATGDGPGQQQMSAPPAPAPAPALSSGGSEASGHSGHSGHATEVPQSEERVRVEARLMEIFSWIHRAGALPAALAREAAEAFATEEGRYAFASVLNRQRNVCGVMNLSAAAYNTLGMMVMQFLDSAHANMHVAPAQLVMIMTQSFYVTAEAEADTKVSCCETEVYPL